MEALDEAYVLFNAELEKATLRFTSLLSHVDPEGNPYEWRHVRNKTNPHDTQVDVLLQSDEPSIYRSRAHLMFDESESATLSDIESWLVVMKHLYNTSTVEKISDIDYVDPMTVLKKLDLRIGWPSSPIDAVALSRIIRIDDQTGLFISVSLPPSRDSDGSKGRSNYLLRNVTKLSPPYIRAYVRLFAVVVRLEGPSARITCFHQWEFQDPNYISPVIEFQGSGPNLFSGVNHGDSNNTVQLGHANITSLIGTVRARCQMLPFIEDYSSRLKLTNVKLDEMYFDVYRYDWVYLMKSLQTGGSSITGEAENKHTISGDQDTHCICFSLSRAFTWEASLELKGATYKNQAKGEKADADNDWLGAFRIEVYEDMESLAEGDSDQPSNSEGPSEGSSKESQQNMPGALAPLRNGSMDVPKDDDSAPTEETVDRRMRVKITFDSREVVSSSPVEDCSYPTLSLLMHKRTLKSNKTRKSYGPRIVLHIYKTSDAKSSILKVNDKEYKVEERDKPKRDTPQSQRKYASLKEKIDEYIQNIADASTVTADNEETVLKPSSSPLPIGESPPSSLKTVSQNQQQIQSRLRRNYIYFTSLLQEPEAKWKYVMDSQGVAVTQLDSIDRTLTIYKAEATFVGVGVWDIFASIITPGTRFAWDKALEEEELLEDAPLILSELWHTKYSATWPISPRDSITIRTAFKSPNSIHVFSSSIDDKNLFPGIMNTEQDYSSIRMQIDLFGWSIESLSPETTRVTLLDQSDPGGWSAKSWTPNQLVQNVAGIGQYTFKQGAPPVLTRMENGLCIHKNYSIAQAQYKVEYIVAKTVSLAPHEVKVNTFIESEFRCDTLRWGTAINLQIEPKPQSVFCVLRHRSSLDGGLWIVVRHTAVDLECSEDHIVRITIDKQEKESASTIPSITLNGTEDIHVDIEWIDQKELRTWNDGRKRGRRFKPSPIPLDQYSTHAARRNVTTQHKGVIGNFAPTEKSFKASAKRTASATHKGNKSTSTLSLSDADVTDDVSSLTSGELSGVPQSSSGTRVLKSRLSESKLVLLSPNVSDDEEADGHVEETVAAVSDSDDVTENTIDLSKPTTLSAEKTEVPSTKVNSSSAASPPPSSTPLSSTLEGLALLQTFHIEQSGLGPDLDIMPQWTAVSERANIHVHKRIIPQLSSTIPVYRADKVIEGATAEELASVVACNSSRPVWDDRVEKVVSLESYKSGMTVTGTMTKPFFPYKGRIMYMSTASAYIQVPSSSEQSSKSTVIFVASSSCDVNSENGAGNNREARFDLSKINTQDLISAKVILEGWIFQTLDPYSTSAFSIPSTRCIHISCIDWGTLSSSLMPSTFSLSFSSTMTNLPKLLLSLETYSKTATFPPPRILNPPQRMLIEGLLSKGDDDTEWAWSLKEDVEQNHHSTTLRSNFVAEMKPLLYSDGPGTQFDVLLSFFLEKSFYERYFAGFDDDEVPDAVDSHEELNDKSDEDDLEDENAKSPSPTKTKSSLDIAPLNLGTEKPVPVFAPPSPALSDSTVTGAGSPSGKITNLRDHLADSPKSGNYSPSHGKSKSISFLSIRPGSSGYTRNFEESDGISVPSPVSARATSSSISLLVGGGSSMPLSKSTTTLSSAFVNPIGTSGSPPGLSLLNHHPSLSSLRASPSPVSITAGEGAGFEKKPRLSTLSLSTSSSSPVQPGLASGKFSDSLLNTKSFTESSSISSDRDTGSPMIDSDTDMERLTVIFETLIDLNQFRYGYAVKCLSEILKDNNKVPSLSDLSEEAMDLPLMITVHEVPLPTILTASLDNSKRKQHLLRVYLMNPGYFGNEKDGAEDGLEQLDGTNKSKAPTWFKSLVRFGSRIQVKISALDRNTLTSSAGANNSISRTTLLSILGEKTDDETSETSNTSQDDTSNDPSDLVLFNQKVVKVCSWDESYSYLSWLDDDSADDSVKPPFGSGLKITRIPCKIDSGKSAAAIPDVLCHVYGLNDQVIAVKKAPSVMEAKKHDLKKKGSIASIKKGKAKKHEVEKDSTTPKTVSVVKESKPAGSNFSLFGNLFSLSRDSGNKSLVSVSGPVVDAKAPTDEDGPISAKNDTPAGGESTNANSVENTNPSSPESTVRHRGNTITSLFSGDRSGSYAGEGEVNGYSLKTIIIVAVVFFLLGSFIRSLLTPSDFILIEQSYKEEGHLLDYLRQWSSTTGDKGLPQYQHNAERKWKEARRLVDVRFWSWITNWNIVVALVRRA